MKKVLSLVLALLMAVSTASMAFAAETADTAITEEAPKLISAADTYAEAIGMLDAYGIMKGVDPNTFNADADSDIQRYQMALFVGRISTGWTDDAQWTDGNVNNSGFTDLDGTPAQNFYGAISYASQKGIIEGYGNGKFGPTDGITYRDALTMVDRTLGYTGLKYPWGNIEKAESLGLTKGITGVAYTDILNRGEVAQIIYNALFVPTTVGDTLGARYFGADLGWKTIIVTATDRARLDPAAKANFPAKGTVGFNVVAADGTLEDTTYYIKAADLGIGDGAHDDEAALGAAYKVLFTIENGKTLVNTLGRQNISLGTVKNTGWKNVDADGKYPIEVAVKGLSLVSKFSKDNYVNARAYNTNEIIIRSALGENIKDAENEHLYAIDWATGDILKINAKNEGEIKVNDKLSYDIVWHYNTILGKYFQILKATKDTEVKVLGINILDDVSELGDLVKTTAASGGFKVLDSINKTTAYAALDLYDLNGDKTADYGLFTEYRIGQFKNDKKSCADHGEKASLKVSAINDLARAAWAVAEGKSEDDYADWAPVHEIKEGQCDHAIAYIDPNGLTPADGDYVIYSYNKATGALHVEKIINKTTTDTDSFVGTGLVRAYDTTKKTVTIGDKTYTYDYDNLLGNSFKYNSDKTAARAIFNAYLGKKFMNFVNYVIVDGKLVHIDGNVGEGSYIIVDSYAGISADGYVVINGYKSGDLKYTQIKIGAYDQWLKGDLYNYALNHNLVNLFAKGSIYRVSSYDAANDAYYVETVLKSAATKDDNGVLYAQYNVDDIKAAGGKAITIEINEDGYKSIDGGDYKRTKADDQYIIVLNRDPRTGSETYAPIIVYTGTAKAADKDNHWFLDGYKLGDTNIYVNVDAKTFKGFGLGNGSEYALTYGLVVSNVYDSITYTPASEAEGNALLGSTTYTVSMIDLYTGAPITAKVLNKKLLPGRAYAVINGWVVDDTAFGKSDVDITTATEKLLRDTRPTWGYKTVNLVPDDLFDKEVVSKTISKYKDNFPKGFTYYKVTTDGEKILLASVNKDGYKAMLKAAGAETLDAFVIYRATGTDNGAGVVYILATGKGSPAGTDTEDISNVLYTGTDGEDAYITGSVDYTVTTDGKVTLDKVTLTYDGDAITADTHKAVYNDKNYFGVAGKCDYEDWKTKVNDKPVYGSISGDLYHAEGKELPYLQTIEIPTDVNLEVGKETTVTITFQAATGEKDENGKDVYGEFSFTLTIKVTEDTTTVNGITTEGYKVTATFSAAGTANDEEVKLEPFTKTTTTASEGDGK